MRLVILVIVILLGASCYSMNVVDIEDFVIVVTKDGDVYIVALDDLQSMVDALGVGHRLFLLRRWDGSFARLSVPNSE